MKAILIDGDLAPELRNGGERRILTRGGASEHGGAAARHASALARALRHHAPMAVIDSYVVFRDGLATDVATIIAALEAAAETEARLVHCSFGLGRADDGLAWAVERLVGQGKLVVASAPASGAAVYPAALPNVFAVQGDARCGPVDWTWLAEETPQAEFAAHAGRVGDPVRGASLAAAHFSGLMLARLELAKDMRDYMRRSARYLGRERRCHPQPA